MLLCKMDVDSNSQTSTPRLRQQRLLSADGEAVESGNSTKPSMESFHMDPLSHALGQRGPGG